MCVCAYINIYTYIHTAELLITHIRTQKGNYKHYTS